MKRKIVCLQVFLTVALLILCCGALFGCGKKAPEPPVVENVAITAVDGASAQGKVGAPHKVTYTASAGSKISVSVQLGQNTATTADFVCVDNNYIFYTEGEYTVTVYAAKNGMMGSDSGKITVTKAAASVTNVQFKAAAGEAYGKVGALHVLSYKATPGYDVEVEFKKDNAATTDVTFDNKSNTVIFHAAGSYSVTVTAGAAPASSSANAQIVITEIDPPTVTLALSENETEEDGEVMLIRSVECAAGDLPERESVAVFYRAGEEGTFEPAEENCYTLRGNVFVPHVAGSWKIAYTAWGKSGRSGTGSATLTCLPAGITLASEDPIRILKNTDSLIAPVAGAVDKYDLTHFELHAGSGVTLTQGANNTLRVKASEMDYFTVSLTYTHKTLTAKTVDFEIIVYSVENLALAPAWVGDPFDGLPDKVLTSMGHLLYFNARSCGGVNRALTYADVKYEVVDKNVTATSGGTGVEILYGAGDNINYPYVIVTNFDNNVAQGTFTLKMTVTDPYTGYSAIATKKMQVVPTTNNNTTAPQNIKKFVEDNSDFFQMGDMDYSNLMSDSRQNMVLTKTGTIMQRSNPDWPLKNNDKSQENADFAVMDFGKNVKDWRLEFKFTLLAPNPASGAVWLGIGLRTGNNNGWGGFFDIHVVNGKLDITNDLDTRPRMERTLDAERPPVESGATMYVRIDCRVVNGLAEYTVSVKTTEGGSYQQYYSCNYSVSSNAGSPGTPVKQLQFTHRSAGGCYIVENVAITAFSA